MKVADVADRDPVTLAPDDTVERAVKMMLDERVLALPVVDANGALVGVFGFHELAALLLPPAVMVAEEMDGLGDLDFVADSLAGLKKRMREAGATLVGDHLKDDSKPSLDPGSSMTEALFLFYRMGREVPVVDEESGRLTGMCSLWQVLEALA